MKNLTSIGRIGIVKYSDEEFFTISKNFHLLNKPDSAVIRIDSVGVCGIFINSVFLETVTGK